MPGVTISAAYGCAGTLIAPAVARQLDFALLDRAISAEVAEKLRVTVADAEGGEIKRSPFEKFFAVLAPLAGGTIGADAAPTVDSGSLLDEAEAFRAQAEQIMREAIAGGAVILGRGATAALRDEPGVLRVRLFGEVEKRVAQAARIEGMDYETAKALQPEVDGARRRYFRRLYRADIDQLDYYHLQLDSTSIPPDVCANLIVAAYRALGA